MPVDFVANKKQSQLYTEWGNGTPAYCSVWSSAFEVKVLLPILLQGFTALDPSCQVQIRTKEKESSQSSPIPYYFSVYLKALRTLSLVLFLPPPAVSRCLGIGHISRKGQSWRIPSKVKFQKWYGFLELKEVWTLLLVQASGPTHPAFLFSHAPPSASGKASDLHRSPSLS